MSEHKVDEIQNKKLFGSYKNLDFLKKKIKPIHLEQFKNNMSSLTKNNSFRQCQNVYEKNDFNFEFIDEKISKVQRSTAGAIIITDSNIADKILNPFNDAKKIAMENGSFAHKTLCEQRDEIAGLVFLTLDDLLGGPDVNYAEIPNDELCSLIENNIQIIVKQNYPWIIKYSEHILKDYYSISAERLRIKLNFLLDDAVYGEGSLGESSGGLIINGLLDELEEYQNQLGSSPNNRKYGMICQILCPSGTPEKRKWFQIDVGVSFSGKRLAGETIEKVLNRECMEKLQLRIHPDVLKKASFNDPNNKLYYGGLPMGIGYDGHEIRIWEVLYPDQFEIIKEVPSSYTFCRCEERNKIIQKKSNQKLTSKMTSKIPQKSVPKNVPKKFSKK